MACENHANTSSSVRSVVPTQSRNRIKEWRLLLEHVRPFRPSETLPEERRSIGGYADDYVWCGLETVEFFDAEISLAGKLAKKTRA